MNAGERAREGGRKHAELRPTSIEIDVSKWAEGSALVATGDTRVLVTASVETRVPGFLAGSGRGWLTAEYSMLPRATSTRSAREVSQGRPSGRTSEIQRLIGRGLRAGVDLAALGERSLTIDCDVLQADAGTRTAAVTGGWVAAVLALSKLYLAGDLAEWPVVAQVAAVSAGVVGGAVLLDLDYAEDQNAEVDVNVVATVDGRLIEVQGTGERRAFERSELDRVLDLALAGIAALGGVQRAALAERLAAVEERRARGRRPPTAPRPERGLWGPPGTKG
ncbi:MAG: ribonuclease PH [Thermoanaerobaculia bacterium]|nr:MAG: ribonuclease PH [Thermoanaerobaculia bacterium]